jgi:tetratricopeptide (TPR) repeat protein
MVPSDSIPKRLRYRFEGDYRRTLTLTRQHQDNPQDLATIVALADVQRRNFKFELAETYLLRALALEPLNQAYLFDLGYLYLENGATTKAWAAFQEIIYLNSGSIEARLAQGRVRESEGALDGAMAIYMKTEADFGAVEGIYAHRALNMVKRGDFGTAITHAREGLALYPDHAPLYYTRGRAYAGLGLWDRAKPDYYDALALDAGLLEAYAALGEVSLAEGNASTAIRAYLRQLDERPGDAAASLNLGKAYLMDLRFKEAIEEWEMLRYLHPFNEEVNQWIPQAYYLYSLEVKDAGQFREALDAHQKAMSLAGRQPAYWIVTALVQAGTASRAHDDYPRSLRYYHLALENDPFNVDSYVGMSRTYRAMRDSTKAMQTLQQALALDPDHPTARIEFNRIIQP